MTKREIASKLDEIVDFSGLEEFIDTPVKRYSSGMCARLGFAVAAHVNPDVLIVDEVLSVGDAHFQGKCVDRMREVIRNGATVLFVSHNMGLVAEFCSRSLLLDAGQVLTVGPTSDVISYYMNRLHQRRVTDQRGPMVISSVCIRDEAGPRDRFASGEKAWIDIDVAVHRPCSSSAVAVSLWDEKHTLVFVTTTELLGHPRVSVNPGDVLRCTFELQLNYARGILFAKVTAGRFAVKFEVYDEWEAAAAIHVSSPEVFFGPVNCFPKLVTHAIQPATDPLRDPVSVATHDGSQLAAF
jgi:lipopolysaccharide transport system ATP-binding protein